MREPFRRLPLVVMFLGAALASTPDAEASVSIAASVVDLARDAEAVARVTVLDRTSAWENGRIVSYSRIRVDRVIVGAAASELRVRALGGVVGNIGQSVDGEAQLAPGASAIVFLARRESEVFVVGRAQGLFTIAKEANGAEIVHVGATGALVARRVRVPARTGDRLAIDLEGVTVDAASNEAVKAWGETHAR